jgi:GNAT superfamily N-acetyltransferase
MNAHALRQNIRIVDFDRTYKEDIIRLAESVIPLASENFETIRQSFEVITDWLEDTLEDETKRHVQNQVKISFRHGLHYVVALDDANRVIGVSGIYAIHRGYLEKLGVHCDGEQLQRLEDPSNFWLGWTAVDKMLQGQGIGTVLVHGAFTKASHALKAQRLSAPYLLVVADKGAVDFYERLGMKLEVSQGVTFIYSLLLAKDSFLTVSK